jgi:hypothetical protein
VSVDSDIGAFGSLAAWCAVRICWYIACVVLVRSQRRPRRRLCHAYRAPPFPGSTAFQPRAQSDKSKICTQVHLLQSNPESRGWGTLIRGRVIPPPAVITMSQITMPREHYAYTYIHTACGKLYNVRIIASIFMAYQSRKLS